MEKRGAAIRWGYRALARAGGFALEIRDLGDPAEPVVGILRCDAPDHAAAQSLARLYESAGLPPAYFAGAAE